MKPIALLRACHPEPAVTVTAVAAVLAIASGRPSIQVITVIAAVGAGQLSVGWSNDWLDAPRDRAVGRSDKPLVTGAVTRRTVGIAAAVAAVTAVAMSLLVGANGWLHVAALAGAWAYNHPLKRTAVSVLPFALSFGLLVPFTYPGADGWLIAAGALLGAAAHFTNVLPDLATDAATGVRGLPHRLGAKRSLITAVALLAAATVAMCLAIGPGGGWAAAVVALWLVAAILARVAAFRAVQVVALLDVVLLLVAAYR